MHCRKGTAKVIYRKRWPAGKKDPEDYTLVFNNMLRELLNGLGVNPVNTCFDLIYFFKSLCGDGVAFQKR